MKIPPLAPNRMCMCIDLSDFSVCFSFVKVLYSAASHAEPGLPVTPRENQMLPQMHGTRKEVLAAFVCPFQKNKERQMKRK